jgi:hypothetical protein
VHWVRPELVAEVKYLTWTGENLLGQVTYQGLREDKPATEVRRTVPTRQTGRGSALLVVHGVRAIRAEPMGTRIDLPMFRDESGIWRRAITLPDEICGPIGKVVLDELVARGLAMRGPVL